MRLVLRFLAIPLAITAVIAFTICVFPIRWDIKAYGPVLPQLELPGLSPGTNVLFVSPDNDWENGHYAQYGLDMITFPEGRFQWMVFKEGDRGGYSWPVTWMIDSSGRFYRAGADPETQATNQVPEDLEIFLRSATVIVSTPEIQARLLERWPALREAKILLIRSSIGSFVESPRFRITMGQCLRIFALAFVLVVGMALAGTIGEGKADGAVRWLNFAFAFPAVLIIHTILVYLLGSITTNAISTAIGIEVLAAACLIWYLSKKRSLQPSQSLQAPRPNFRGASRLPALLASTGVALFIALCCLRLDFDGDMFTQYLPVARYHYLEGRHDPQALLSRYGVMTQATYPPGFPILISTLMWTAEVPAGMPVQCNYQTNLMVFLYRLLITSLHLSFLLAVGALFKTLGVEGGGLSWLLPVVSIPLVLPLFLGQPGAAEIYLVPMIGFSVLAFFAALRLNESIYTPLGLFIGGFALFIKREGLLILCLILLTWYVAVWLRPKRFSLRETTSHAAGLLLGLSPFLLWRFNLGSLAGAEYFFYEKPSIAKLFTDFALLGKIAEKGMKILLGNNYWVVLFLVLPLFFANDLFSRRSFKDVIIPLGIVVHVAAITCVYLFSKHPGGPLLHMDISYERLVATPVLATILYGAKTLFESGTIAPNKTNV